MNIKRFIGKCKKGLDVINLKAKPSYSQVGEDMIINYLFNSIHIEKPSYLDIGANEPVIGSNTYFFYKKGSRGVCVEPNAQLCKTIQSARPLDTVLNIGIGLSDMEAAKFYLFPLQYSGWSTFSGEEAKAREKQTGIMATAVMVPLKNINDIIRLNFSTCPNFISIDVEGLDLEILQSLDFDTYKPEVICVETISFSTTNKETKVNNIIDFVHSKGYITYADTHVNTIFCRKELFKSC